MEQAQKANGDDDDDDLGRAHARLESISAPGLASEENPNCGLDGAPVPQEAHRAVQVDVAVSRDHHRACPAVAGMRKLLEAPPDDAFVFRIIDKNCFDRRGHCASNHPRIT
jgi:hypothetical protein